MQLKVLITVKKGKSIIYIIGNIDSYYIWRLLYFAGIIFGGMDRNCLLI